MSSSSVCSHTRDKQIGLPLRSRPILLSPVWLQNWTPLSPSTIINLKQMNYNNDAFFIPRVHLFLFSSFLKRIILIKKLSSSNRYRLKAKPCFGHISRFVLFCLFFFSKKYSSWYNSWIIFFDVVSVLHRHNMKVAKTDTLKVDCAITKKVIMFFVRDC